MQTRNFFNKDEKSYRAIIIIFLCVNSYILCKKL